MIDGSTWRLLGRSYQSIPIDIPRFRPKLREYVGLCVVCLSIHAKLTAASSAAQLACRIKQRTVTDKFESTVQDFQESIAIGFLLLSSRVQNL